MGSFLQCHSISQRISHELIMVWISDTTGKSSAYLPYTLIVMYLTSINHMQKLTSAQSTYNIKTHIMPLVELSFSHSIAAGMENWQTFITSSRNKITINTVFLACLSFQFYMYLPLLHDSKTKAPLFPWI